ncbi:hypothetical protein ACL9RI_24305 [Janthinobacterium sp. Mn2066]|uniref:hypothetical protein n=1 Tax=Janthinobacterium sp. Mn2066 TaxID=3395264 RepID=UPI003BD27DDB
MAYILRGKLCGLICAECPEPLSNVIVRLYRTRDTQNVTALAVASAKETFAILSEEEVQAKAPFLLAEVRTDADGNYSFTLGEHDNYQGEAVEVDVFCPAVPHLKPGSKEPVPLQLSITTIQPRWRQAGDDLLAVWNYCLPQRFWCLVRARFGAWTICGRLRTCEAPQTPIAGATVRAFDADWLQDDALGDAVTDATGRFRIDYLTSDFTLTPFSPFINVEFASGPDVYFTAQLGSVTILSETQANGRQPGRENVGHCFCVELCSSAVLSPDVEGLPHWQQVEIFDIHPFPSVAGFSPQGYAGGPAASYVFAGGVTLKGNCPLRNSTIPANPLEYRFLIGEWGWSGGADDPTTLPTVAPGSLAPLTQILGTLVGYVFYTNGLGLADSAQVIIDTGDLQAGGWIRVDNKAVTVDMRNGSTAVVNVNSSNFLRTFDLLTVNTPAITSLHPAKLPGGLPILDAGRSLSTAESEPVRRYRLGFEVRDGTTLALVASDGLDSIVFDNSPVIVALDLEELRSNACNPIAGGVVHILYTIDHPHLRFFNLAISNNNGITHPPPPLPAASFTPPPPAANYLFRGGAGGPHLSSNNGGFPVNVALDPPCAYRVAIAWQTRHYLAGSHGIDRLYCK